MVARSKDHWMTFSVSIGYGLIGLGVLVEVFVVIGCIHSALRRRPSSGLPLVSVLLVSLGMTLAKSYMLAMNLHLGLLFLIWIAINLFSSALLPLVLNKWRCRENVGE
jgi:hypothetical protein